MLDKSYRQNYTEKAELLVQKMTLEEKVRLMSGRDTTLLSGKERYNLHPYPAGGNERLGVPNVEFIDGPRGVVVGNATAFPVAMARGATFDTSLEEKVGQAIGREVRASGGNLFAGVCINMPYNPGWGRSQEVYSEDNYILGAMASALVKGVQSQHVMACVKHFAFNSMENARFKVNVTASRRTEREQYLAHFKDVIDAGAASVMSAYNHYQGKYCGHSDYLLNQVLKHEWGFDGFVMSDFVWGVNDTIEAANGGQDMEMMRTKFFGPALVDAVRRGDVPESKINDAALRIVRTTLAFEDNAPKIDKSVIACSEHTRLARRVAEEGITLIKNTHDTLPLNPRDINTIAVIGRLAKSDNIGDHGSSRVYPPYVVTPYEGLKKAFPEVHLLYSDGSNAEETERIVKTADAAIFVVGYNYDDEGEYVSNDQSEESLANGDSTTSTTGFSKGGDRRSLNLHPADIKLINTVAPGCKRSIVVLIGGNMILTHAWQDNVNAIIDAYYPGMEGGNALAEIISGKINPSGKLPFAIPEDAKSLPTIDWESTEIEYGYLHGYNKLETEHSKVDYAFGTGLSYTAFEINHPKFKRDGDQLVASVDVTNTGARFGAEIIQLYIGFSNSKLFHPHKELKGFKRVELNPNETKDVVIKMPLNKIAYFDEAQNQMIIEKIPYDCYIGNSSSDAEKRHAIVEIK